jgi:hypothetical protein
MTKKNRKYVPFDHSPAYNSQRQSGAWSLGGGGFAAQ